MSANHSTLNQSTQHTDDLQYLHQFLPSAFGAYRHTLTHIIVTYSTNYEYTYCDIAEVSGETNHEQCETLFLRSQSLTGKHELNYR